MSTQQQILSAAESLFARQGYDSTTMDQIARMAGLTKGAVYYFFRNKAELFCTIVDEGISYIAEQCRSILEAARSSREIARDVISFYVNISYDNASLFLILFGSRSADPAVRAMFDERIGRLLVCIRDILQAGMDDGLLRSVNPEILARMFAGCIYGLLALPGSPDRADAAELMRMMIETGVFTSEKEGGI